MGYQSNTSFVYGLELDGKGSGSDLSLEDSLKTSKPIWLHFGGLDPETRSFMVEKIGLESEVIQRLLVEDTRPYVKIDDDFSLIFVRGVNLNPDSKPQDMIMLRVFIQDNLIITVRRRPLKAVRDVIDDFSEGVGANNAKELLANIIGKLIDRMWPVHDQIDDFLSEYEDFVFSNRKPHQTEGEETLHSIRLQILQLYRYLRPMCDTLSTLKQMDKSSWRKSTFAESIDNSEHRLTQLVADLEHFKSRSDLINQELSRIQSQQQNKATYFLTVIATLFLPPSLVLSILGSGSLRVPFSNIELPAFMSVAVVCLSILVPYLLLKRMNLLPK